MSGGVDVEGLRELDARATKGPWRMETERDGHNGSVTICEVRGEGGGVYFAVSITGNEAEDKANAQLIVALRNAAPALLSRIEELEGLLRGIVANCQTVRSNDTGAWGPMDPVNPSYLVSMRSVEAARSALTAANTKGE